MSKSWASDLSHTEIVNFPTSVEVNLAKGDIVSVVTPVAPSAGGGGWYRLALDVDAETSVDVNGLDAVVKLRDACNAILAHQHDERVHGEPSPRDSDTELVEVGGLNFTFCSHCQQPTGAARAAVDSFAFIGQLQDQIRQVADTLQEMAVRARVIGRMDGGYDGMHDPFHHWAVKGGGF